MRTKTRVCGLLTLLIALAGCSEEEGQNAAPAAGGQTSPAAARTSESDAAIEGTRERDPSEAVDAGTKRPAEPASDNVDKRGAIIWTTGDESTIYAADFDGKHLTPIVTNSPGADSVAFDPKSSNLYYHVYSSGGPNSHSIHEQDLRTGLTQERFVGLAQAADVACDSADGKLYWACLHERNLERGNLDGSDVETFVTDLGRPDEIIVNEAAGTIYWTEHAGGKVSRINRDGSGRTTILSGLRSPVMAMAIHAAQSRLYVCETGADRIISVDFDGGDQKTVVEGPVDLDGIAIDAESGQIFWMQRGGIHRANLDGSDARQIVEGHTPKYGSMLVVPYIPGLLQE